MRLVVFFLAALAEFHDIFRRNQNLAKLVLERLLLDALFQRFFGAVLVAGVRVNDIPLQIGVGGSFPHVVVQVGHDVELVFAYCVLVNVVFVVRHLFPYR